jgi:hypothetical protein
MTIYRNIKILFLASLIICFYAYAQDTTAPSKKKRLKKKKPVPVFVVEQKPALGPQLKKTPMERLDKQSPGILNSINASNGDSSTEDEDWGDDTGSVAAGSSTGLSRDFSEMGSGLQDVMQKHNFTFGGRPYSIQGLPILYTSKSTGFNMGLRLSFADLKTEDPYTFLFTFQFWATDRGAKNHEISLDIPEFFSRHWRVRLGYTYPEVIDNNYFGIGNNSVYDKDFITPNSNRFISRTYYQYIFIYPKFTFDISYKFFREKFSIYGGIGLDKATIKPQDLDNRSKIFAEQPYGYNGGKTNYVKAGIKYDSRDYPMNPSKGIVLAGTYTNHAKFMGSDYQYSNVDMTYMGFFSFLKYFVLGHRIMIDQTWGDLPFFALAEFNSYDDYQGLGGQDTLRGAPTFRFIDNLKFINQIEIRTRFYNGVVFGQHMEMFLVPFWDIGRVWDRHKKIAFDQMHNTLGNEFRFTWNSTFIASFTMGFSKDAFSTYLSFGESFD